MEIFWKSIEVLTVFYQLELEKINVTRLYTSGPQILRCLGIVEAY